MKIKKNKPKKLAKNQISELIDWDSEKYRQLINNNDKENL